MKVLKPVFLVVALSLLTCPAAAEGRNGIPPNAQEIRRMVLLKKEMAITALRRWLSHARTKAHPYMARTTAPCLARTSNFCRRINRECGNFFSLKKYRQNLDEFTRDARTK